MRSAKIWLDCMDAQADLSHHWSYKSYCRFCPVLAHIHLNSLCIFGSSRYIQIVDIIIRHFVTLPLRFKYIYFYIFSKNSFAKIIKAPVMKNTVIPKVCKFIEAINKYFKRSVLKYFITCYAALFWNQNKFLILMSSKILDLELLPTLKSDSSIA